MGYAQDVIMLFMGEKENERRAKMKDQKLREAFVALCRHLNVGKMWHSDEIYDHDYRRFSEKCRLVRHKELEKLQSQIEELQQSIKELRRN